MALYALNLSDPADTRAAPWRRCASTAGEPDVRPRAVMILVEWPSRGSFRAFLDDPEHAALHPLRENGTRNYLWWLY